MSLVKDNSAIWSDIKQLYNSLNTTAEKFGMSTAPVPEKQGQEFIPSDITDLKTLVQALTANKYIGSVADTSAVSIPVRDTIIQPTSASQLETIIDNAYRQCIHDSSYNSSYDSTYDASYRASYQSSYDSSYNSSNLSFLSSYNSTHNSSYDSSYDSVYNASYRASYKSSYNSSNNTSCASQCSRGSFGFTGSFR